MGSCHGPRRSAHRTAWQALLTFSLTAAVLAYAGLASAAKPAMVETPFLAQAVERGELPPVSDRIPDVPSVVRFDQPGRSPGEPGGDLQTLMAKPKDVRLMTVYGYARLVAYDESFNLVPDLLERFEIKEGRIFTLYLRPGHKWSDGAPFTSEDFRYFWEEMAQNEELAPFGPPKPLLVDGERPTFEVIDETTVRFSWSQPNTAFLPALAGAAPLWIYRPSHYLKQFHKAYADADTLKAMVKKTRQRNWAGLHHRRDRQYRFDNPVLPTLQPWYNTTDLPAERFVFVRNPFYHRIDENGHQLPYLDRVIIKIADSKIIPAKTGAAETDLQARYIRFDHYTFLKRAEKRHNFDVRLWNTIKGAQVALYPNLNNADPVWRDVLRDVRFRRAMSLAIDRHEINQVIYYGLAREGNNSVLEESPLFRPEYRNGWATFDLDRANQLLDDMGLTERDDRGVRLLPDGRPMELIIDTAGESTEETDVLELISDSWLKAGVKLYSRPSQREVFRNRVYAGESLLSIWSGLSNAVPNADTSPEEFAPTEQDQLQWSKFGKYYQTSGQSGVKPDIQGVIDLANLHDAWRHTYDTEERARIWHQILKLHSDEIYTIGVVNGVQRPVVVNNDLRNVPEVGVYNWDPGSAFGVYKPDTFWFTEERRKRDRSQ